MSRTSGLLVEVGFHFMGKFKTGVALGLVEAPARHDRILEYGGLGVDRSHSSRSMRSISSMLGD